MWDFRLSCGELSTGKLSHTYISSPLEKLVLKVSVLVLDRQTEREAERDRDRERERVKKVNMVLNAHRMKRERILYKLV